MKPGLLERIQSFGHWRVNIRPYAELPEPLSFNHAAEVVEQARVSIRGWDFPHISRRNDDGSGFGRAENYYENWCDWQGQVEFWRMYRSGQFLSYKALSYDVPNEFFYLQNRSLSVTDTIYAITEFCEFSYRLVSNGLHRAGSTIHVTLGGAANRQLWVGPHRMPFLDPRQTQADSIKIMRILPTEEWEKGPADAARSMILELFDYFGWNPSIDQIKTEQDAFYRKDFR